MNDLQPHKFESEGTLQDEDDSNGIAESARRTWNTDCCYREICVAMESGKESLRGNRPIA